MCPLNSNMKVKQTNIDEIQKVQKPCAHCGHPDEGSSCLYVVAVIRALLRSSLPGIEPITSLHKCQHGDYACHSEIDVKHTYKDSNFAGFFNQITEHEANK